MLTNIKNTLAATVDRSFLTRFIPVFLLIMAAGSDFLAAQSDSVSTELSSISLPNDSIPLDSLLFFNDSIPTDSIGIEKRDLINSTIFYDAVDTMILDAINRIVYLYGQAKVKFETIELEADYIEYDFNNNVVMASGLPDSTGTMQGKPIFRDGPNEFRPNSLRYNFRTKQGYIEEVVTQDGEFYLHAKETKRKSNEWVHIRNGKFTTCDKENPHYHFHLTRAIVVPNEKIVSGPVYMKVRKVPTPLALPFGFFPNSDRSTHGVLIPAYGDGGNLGYFFRDAGYYIPLGPYADTKILGDIYTRGSWTVRNITSYKKRYKYTGNFNVSHSVLKQGLRELPSSTQTREFFIRWQHNQDSKARPGTSFSANVNAGSRNNFTNNINSSQEDYLSNTFQSNIRWAKNWAGKPYNLSVNMRHSQNSQTGNVDFTLPALAFSVSRFYLPLGFLNNSAGKKKWYEMIGVTYAANFDNRLTVQDSRLRFDNMGNLSSEFRNGIKHTLNMTTSLKAGYVSINPSISLTDRWYFNYLQLGLDPESLSTTRDTVAGFRTAPDWNMSVNANTKIYGTFLTSKTGAVRAIRHVMTPNVGFSFRPDMGVEETGYFGTGGSLVTYSPFDIGIYGRPNNVRSGSVNFSLINNLEAKVRNRKESASATKKLAIIENFRIASSYDLFRDSLNLSNITTDAFTTLWENLSLNYSASYNPYDRDSLGRTINTFLWDSQGKIGRLAATSLALNMNLRSKNRRGQPNESNVSEEELDLIRNNPQEFVDFSIPWNLNVAYNIRINKVFDPVQQADTNSVTQSVLFNGDFTIFKNWKFGFNSGYDFVTKEFTPTTLSLYWDLHCWEFTATVIPFGIRQSYALQLNIKSSTLKDLKLQRRRNLGQGNLLL